MIESFLLDPKTVFLLYFWGNLFICVLIFSYSFSYTNNDSRKLVKRFGYGKLLLTISWLLVFLRNIAPDFISINIANSIMLLACYYESMAILSLLKSKKYQFYRLQFGITIFSILLFNIAVFLNASINTRIIVGCIGIFVIYIIPIINYFREIKKNIFRTLYVLCYAGFEVLIVIKVIYNYVNPQQYFFSFTTFESFYNISLFLLTLIGTVGFLLLVKEKQDVLIQKLLNDKNQFFSIISHDLRGPLGSSMQLSELLTQDIDNYSREEVKEITEMLHQSNTNIKKLLDNLLEWSKVQTGLIEFSPKNILLNNLITENVEFINNAVLTKKIDLSFESSEMIHVKADKNMVDTILRNLLTNAVKFTDKHGEIILRIQKQKKEALISISDNGMGMSDYMKEKLFEINTKVIQKGTDDEYGNGLGLLLCSEFIKQHQGEIWVESEVGKGSTFKFTLPLAGE